MPAKQNSPGGDSVATIVARIDERTGNMAEEITGIKDDFKEYREENNRRFNNHGGRLRDLELNSAVNKGEKKGREFSFKRVAAWIGIIVSIIGAAAVLYAITPP